MPPASPNPDPISDQIKGPLGCLVSVKKRLKYKLVIKKVNVLLGRKKLVCYLRLQYLQGGH